MMLPVDDTELRLIFERVNTERESHNLPPLSWCEGLAASAQIRAEDCNSKHERPDGRKWITSLEEAGVICSTVGENLARGWSPLVDVQFDLMTSNRVVDEWTNSQGHRENILNPDFELFGVGAVDMGAWRYYVQHFGKGVEP
jgi:uncharacterized protein YkwD